MTHKLFAYFHCIYIDIYYYIHSSSGSRMYGGGGSGSVGSTRVRHKEPVILNIYDLAPVNQYLYPMGLGMFHSGVEIHGVEYTFSKSGVVEMKPKDESSGAPLRASLSMGSVQLSRKQVEAKVSDLKSLYQPGSYDLITKNCNVFADDLVYKLLGRPIPAWVNRSATFASCCKCLIPNNDDDEPPPQRSVSQASFSGRGRRLADDRKSFFRSGSSSSKKKEGGGGGSIREERRRLLLKAAMSRRHDPVDDL